MNRILFVAAAAVIIVIAVASGNGPMMMRAAERGLAWSISREIARGVFHEGGRR